VFLVDLAFTRGDALPFGDEILRGDGGHEVFLR
jgi:hypothetical protein